MLRAHTPPQVCQWPRLKAKQSFRVSSPLSHSLSLSLHPPLSIPPSLLQSFPSALWITAHKDGTQPTFFFFLGGDGLTGPVPTTPHPSIHRWWPVSCRGKLPHCGFTTTLVYLLTFFRFYKIGRFFFSYPSPPRSNANKSTHSLSIRCPL